MGAVPWQDEDKEYFFFPATFVILLQQKPCQSGRKEYFLFIYI